MIGTSELDAIAWVDEETDIILVKVRRFVKGPNGRPVKQGMILKVPQEFMCDITPAMAYPHKTPQEITKESDLPENRFTSLADEV